MISVSSLPPFTVGSSVHLYDISSCLFLQPLVVRLKAELFFVPFRSMSACFLEVCFPFAFSHPFYLFLLPSFSVSSFSLPLASSASTRNISFSRLCSFRYLAHPPCDYLNFHVALSLLLFDSSEARIFMGGRFVKNLYLALFPREIDNLCV